jgi:hypothetical protein
MITTSRRITMAAVAAAWRCCCPFCCCWNTACNLAAADTAVGVSRLDEASLDQRVVNHLQTTRHKDNPEQYVIKSVIKRQQESKQARRRKK